MWNVCGKLSYQIGWVFRINYLLLRFINFTFIIIDYLWLHDGKCGCKEGENYIYDSIRLPKVNGI